MKSLPPFNTTFLCRDDVIDFPYLRKVPIFILHEIDKFRLVSRYLIGILCKELLKLLLLRMWLLQLANLVGSNYLLHLG